MNAQRRMGFLRSDERTETEALPAPPPMSDIVSPGAFASITEAHQETRDRIDVTRAFIASHAFFILPENQRILKLRELEWLAKVDAQLNLSYGGAQVEPKE